MIGVIPAAGEGKRLGMGVKALVEIRGRPLIDYPIQNLVDAGIETAVIIQNNGEISSNYRVRDDIKLYYVNQRQRKGIADAIRRAKTIVGNDDMIIILGDIIFTGSLQNLILSLYMNGLAACVFGSQKVYDLEEITRSFGYKKGVFNLPCEIVEKPENPFELEPRVGLGIYAAKPALFKYIDRTPVNPLSGEVEITDTLNLMAKDLRVDTVQMNGFYVNINTKEDFWLAENHL